VKNADLGVKNAGKFFVLSIKTLTNAKKLRLMVENDENTKPPSAPRTCA